MVTIATLFKSNLIIGGQHTLLYISCVELINYFGEKGFKILNTTPRLLETGEDFCFVTFLTSMIPF